LGAGLHPRPRLFGTQRRMSLIADIEEVR